MTVIVVKGRPVSINSSNSSIRRWKNKVATEAKKVCATPSGDNNLHITITFFYKTFPDFDTDNISKPIVDALKEVAYHDDRQVRKRDADRIYVRGSFTIINPDPKVNNAIADGDDFVCITIEKADSGVIRI